MLVTIFYNLLEVEVDEERSIRTARNKKNPRVFGDEYVTSDHHKRRTPTQKDMEESSVNDSASLQKKYGRKREIKAEVGNVLYSNIGKVWIKESRMDLWWNINKITKEWLTFEWDRREVQRYQLGQSLTSNLFWHIVSSQYFPLNTYNLAQNFEKFYEEEVENKLLKRKIKEKEFMSLFNLDQYSEGIQMWKDKFVTSQLLENPVKAAGTENKNSEEEKSPEDKAIEPKEDLCSTDSMIKYCENYLEEINKNNNCAVAELSK